jgi:3-oxoacyl-[acyl-carrier-protein] synthase II
LKAHSSNGNVRLVPVPVRVAGIGIVSPFGTSHDSFRDALLEGRSAIAPVRGFDTTGCRTILAAEIPQFDASPWVPPMKMRRMDRTGVFAVAATKLALEDAKASIAPEGDDRIGVVLGTWTAGGGSTQQFLDALFRSGPSGAPALLFDSTVANAAASLAGLEHRFRGPNMTVSNKEASGVAAVVTAVDLIREGRATALVAGAADGVFEPFYKGHDRFRVMSSHTSFSRHLAPFDVERDGFVIGEGAFNLWLEAGDRNATDGAMHGEILGVAASSAACRLNAWPGDPAPLIRNLRCALEDAGLNADAVDVVYASANATRTLDAIEARALTDLFGGTRTIVTSIKGALGESGAAGTAACAAALLCGRVGRVPPIAGLECPDPATADLRLARTATDAPGPIALINSVASGGALFSVVVRTRLRGSAASARQA